MTLLLMGESFLSCLDYILTLTPLTGASRRWLPEQQSEVVHPQTMRRQLLDLRNHKDLRGHTNAQQWGRSRQQRGSQTTGDGEQWGKRVENGPDVY